VASAFTHAIAGLAIGTAFRGKQTPARYWVLGATFAALPDLDGVGFWLGVPYESTFGHRGFSHSLIFAAMLAALGLLAFRDRVFDADRTRIWMYLFLATASHGVLDAMTSGGGGVAFFAPVVNERYFFPWRPILVSPMSVRRFFSERGVRILATELVYVWIPAALFAATALAVRRRSTADPASPQTVPDDVRHPDGA
jgi:inner membrane protein